MKRNRKYADRPKYMVKAVKKRRKKIREMAIRYKGGKYVFCGYSKYAEALDFHHVEDDSKNFGISAKGYTRSWERLKKELDKCILVCANCHREIHAEVLQPPKGNLGGKSG